MRKKKTKVSLEDKVNMVLSIFLIILTGIFLGWLFFTVLTMIGAF